MLTNEYRMKTRHENINKAKKYLAQQQPTATENISFCFKQTGEGRYMKGWIHLFITFNQSYMVKLWLTSVIDPFDEFNGFVAKIFKGKEALLNIDEDPTLINLVVLPYLDCQVRFVGFIDLLFYQDEEFDEDFQCIFDVVIDKEYFIDSLFQSFELFMLHEYKIEEWEYIGFNPLFDTDLPQESYKYFTKLFHNYKNRDFNRAKRVDNLLSNIQTMITTIEKKQYAQVTKLMPIVKLKSYFDTQTTYQYVIFLVENILSYLNANQSLELASSQEYLQNKIEDCELVLAMIRDKNFENIDIEKYADTLYAKYKKEWKRKYAFYDSDVWTMYWALKYTVKEETIYLYYISKRYCSVFHDGKYRLNHFSVQRLDDIYKFISSASTS